MNDADFEMLARTAAAGLIERGVKPYTLPDETWLRVRALELAVGYIQHSDDDAVGVYAVAFAQKFYEFLKGESSENLRRQDER
jgi:hypothetical protein